MHAVKPLAVATVVVAALVLAAPFTPSAAGQDRAPDAPLPRSERVAGLGASVRDLDAADARSRKVPGGALVETVRPDSPAATAGLKRADVIVELDGERVKSGRQLARLVREAPAGQPVKATIVREGKKMDLSIVPSPERGADVWFDADRVRERMRDVGPILERLDLDGLGFAGPRRPVLGAAIEPLTPQLGDYFGAKEGVLVTSVTGNSPASRAGLKAGDVITAVNGDAVRTPAAVTRALRRAGDGAEVTIGIVRDRKASTVTATIDAASRTTNR